MYLDDKAPSCRGDLHVMIIKNGKLVKRIDEHNLVVDGARVRLAELVAGIKPGQHITQIGLGSGHTPADKSDTKLTDQQLFPVKSATVSGWDARFDFLIDETQANGLAIQEFGLFCKDGVMFSHRVRGGVVQKENDIQLKGYWILHF